MSNINGLAKPLFSLVISSPVAMSLIYKGFSAGPQKANNFKGLVGGPFRPSRRPKSRMGLNRFRQCPAWPTRLDRAFVQ